MNLPLFFAQRIYNNGDDRQQVSRPAIRIATAGVAIGLAVMVVSTCIILGFKHTIRDKVIGFGSHLQVADFMTLQTAETYPIQMGDSMMALLRQAPHVGHVQRFADKQGILKTDEAFLGVSMKGIGPEYDTTFIHQNMVEGSIPQFSDSVSRNRLLISKTIAGKLKLGCGDRIFAYFIDNNGVRARRFTVAGIYQTNLEQYDNVTCFTDLYTVRKLNAWEPDQATGAEIALKDVSKLQETADYLVRNVNKTIDDYGETYASKTIRELSPQIFSWLDLLDMNIWIIMALMIVVACVTMISGLLIIILERTTTIGILKALGARNRSIRHIFLWFATFILGKSLLIGNLLGLSVLLLQKHTGLFTLDPTKYYLSTVPVEINLPAIIAINLATLLISLLVLIAPSYLISHIHPAKSMRYE